MAGSPIFRRITLTEVKKASNKRGSLLRELAGLEKEEKDIIKNHHDPSYSNWRSSFLIEGGMTTKGFMQTTFPAEGDTDLDSIDSTGDIEQFPDMHSNQNPAEAPGWPTQGVEILSSGSGSGDSGGFDIGTDYLAVNNAGSPVFNAVNLDPIDCTRLDEIVITGIRGNGSNGGTAPADDRGASLEVNWQSPETIGGTGYPTFQPMYYNAAGDIVPEGTTNELWDEYGIIIPSSGSSKYDPSHTGLREWTLPIPSWVRGENISFTFMNVVLPGEGLNYGITKIAFRRKSPITVFVSLDSPEASSFMRIGSPSRATQSKKKREKQLREQLEASKDYTDKKFGENFPGSETPPPGEEDPTEQAKRAPGLGEFEPEVVDYNTWKQETKKEDPKAKTTPQEYEKWKDDKKLKSFAAVRDAQGKKEIIPPSPTSDKKDFDTFSQGRSGQVMKDAQTDAVQKMGGVDNIPADAPEEIKDLLTNKSPLKALQNAITSFDKKALDAYLAPDKGLETAVDTVVDKVTGTVDAVAKGYKEAGVNKAAETFIKYITNTLPEVLDNEYLGQEYVDQMIKQGSIDTDPDSPTYGTFQAGENVIGGAQPPTYDPETGKISIKYNYDYKTNAQDFADKEAAGQEIGPLSKLYHFMAGPYSSDASLNVLGSKVPILGNAFDALAGVLASELINNAKNFGGAEGKPGELTIDVEELKDKNYTLFMDLVKNGQLKGANEKIGEPAFTKTPQNLSQGQTIAAAQKNADWKVLLKNLPSWFSTYGNPEVEEYRGVKGVWGYNYSGGKTFLVPGIGLQGADYTGQAESGYGTPRFDRNVPGSGTSWIGLDADGSRGVDAFIDKHGLEPTQPVEWEGTPEQQEDLYKDLNDLFDTDPDRAQEIMQQVEDDPEYKKLTDRANELRDILNPKTQAAKDYDFNPAAGAAYADYEALQAKNDADIEKQRAALAKKFPNPFDVTPNPDGTAKSMEYKPAYAKELKRINDAETANNKAEKEWYNKNYQPAARGKGGYKDIQSAKDLRTELEKEQKDLMSKQLQMFDKILYNALNPKFSTDNEFNLDMGKKGAYYTGDPNNPYKQGRDTKVAASPDPGPAPVKPGDIPTQPSSPYLPGKSPYKIARYKKPAYTPPYVQDWDSLGGGGKRTSPTGGDLKNWDPNAKIKASTQKDFGSIAQTYGGQGVDAATLASTASATQTKKKKKKTTVTASYKPKGSMIIEKRNLKSPNQFFNADDIKPDYPKDPPPDMVDGKWHPDLVDSAKTAEKFNKLDPASAKAMPKTGDPNIDAKVEKAKNNPDKDGPEWHKKVTDKIKNRNA
jgi:hypothetical protein